MSVPENRSRFPSEHHLPRLKGAIASRKFDLIHQEWRVPVLCHRSTIAARSPAFSLDPSRLRANWIVSLVLVVAASFVPRTNALGQISQSYTVSHNFNLDFTAITSDLPDVYMGYNLFAWARSGWCPRFRFDVGLDQIISPTTKSVVAGPVNSIATGVAEVSPLTIQPGRAWGTYTARGSSYATRLGCFPQRSGGAWARSSCKVRTRVKVPAYILPSGAIVYVGLWTSERRISGGTRPKITLDPVYARLYDDNMNLIESHKLMDVKAEVFDGKASWNQIGDSYVLAGEGEHYRIRIDIGAPVMPNFTQWGAIEVEVKNGVVVESYANGKYAYLRDGNPTNNELPNVGYTGAWSVPMDPVDMYYVLGQADVDYTVEVEFAGGGQEDTDDAAICIESRPHYLTDLGNGCNGQDTSIPQGGLSRLGFGVSEGEDHLMEFCAIPIGARKQLETMMWPIFQEGEDSYEPPQAVFVRIWDGSPLQGGVVIAGDLTTNRLIVSDEFPQDYAIGTGVFRVDASDPESCTRPIKELYMDMNWAPTLNPGQVYGFEVVVRGWTGAPSVQSPVSPYPSDPGSFHPALQFDVSSSQWSELFDNGFGCQIPFQLWGDDVAASMEEGDGSGILEFNGSTGVGSESRFYLSLPTSADIRLQLFDASGRLLETLAEESFDAGRYEWNVAGSGERSSGVYFGRLEVRTSEGETVRTARAVIVN